MTAQPDFNKTDSESYEWTQICVRKDLIQEGGLRILIDDMPPLAVWWVKGKIYATDDTCTHGGSSLTKDGYVEGTMVECGLHQGCFDVSDGRVLAAPCRVPLRTYPVKIENDKVLVDLNMNCTPS